MQAYNYRVNITSKTENRVLFTKPEVCDPEPFKKRYGKRVLSGKLANFSQMFISNAGANQKHDANWCDVMGGSTDYPDGN